MTKGFIAGSFDLIHPGYIMAFVEAKKNCSHLVVALQDDPTFDRLHKNKPVNTLFERHLVLSSIKYVDEIIPYNTEEELSNLVKVVRPDIRFLGDDYQKISKNNISGYLWCKNLHFLSREHGYSTTKLRDKIVKL